MNPNEALLTIAEIAIATIGFAGIMSALRPKSSDSGDAMHRLRLRLMVEASASVMIFAFLPFVLMGLVDSEKIWALGSGVLATTSPLLVGSIYVRQRRLFGTTLLRETLLFDTSVVVMAMLAVIEIGDVQLLPCPPIFIFERATRTGDGVSGLLAVRRKSRGGDIFDLGNVPRLESSFILSADMARRSKRDSEQEYHQASDSIWHDAKLSPRRNGVVKRKTV